VVNFIVLQKFKFMEEEQSEKCTNKRDLVLLEIKALRRKSLWQLIIGFVVSIVATILIWFYGF
jgi:hypothetical protein